MDAKHRNMDEKARLAIVQDYVKNTQKIVDMMLNNISADQIRKKNLFYGKIDPIISSLADLKNKRDEYFD